MNKWIAFMFFQFCLLKGWRLRTSNHNELTRFGLCGVLNCVSPKEMLKSWLPVCVNDFVNKAFVNMYNQVKVTLDKSGAEIQWLVS